MKIQPIKGKQIISSLKVMLILVVTLTSACQINAPKQQVQDTSALAVTNQTRQIPQGKPVYFGVLAIDSAVSVYERYGPLMKYLSTKINRPVELVPLSQESQFIKVSERALDFTTNNPLAAVQVRRLYNTQFLVTHQRPKTGTQFSGLIIAAPDSGIETIQDLQGKRAACVAFQTAAAGCTFQIHHLKKQGFDPFKDFKSFSEIRSQDNIVLSVLNGSIDVGFVRTGQIQKMVDQGLISSIKDVAIIDKQEDSFYYKHSTELYPEWPIAALETTDKALVEQVQAALLELPSNHESLETLGATGFVPAVNYEKLDNLITTLKLKSWETQ